MISFEPQNFSRLLIFGLATLVIAGSLKYSDYLAQELAKKEKSRIELYRDGLIFASNPEVDNICLNFVLSKLLTDTISQVPKILVGEDGVSIDDHNLQIEAGLSKADSLIALKESLEKLKTGYPPIKAEFDANRFQYVYYGESRLLRQLRWFPYIQLLVVFVFIGVIFYGFAIAKRNEQNRVWVGLAKETAHQLGTPVSSLMAWIELLKLRSEKVPENRELISEMERDILRLENIAERFSKIGSKPELIEVSLKDVLDRSAEYIRKRMTQRGSIQLFVNNQIPLESPLFINPQLFAWVIENLLKNALDAIQSNEGKITINAGEKGGNYFIDVSDTGKGIPKSNFKKVFEPGFTTKKRGWGLGLSLTKRIVENYHRGKIFVKSSEVDKGTTFRITLPKNRKNTSQT